MLIGSKQKNRKMKLMRIEIHFYHTCIVQIIHVRDFMRCIENLLTRKCIRLIFRLPLLSNVFQTISLWLSSDLVDVVVAALKYQIEIFSRLFFFAVSFFSRHTLSVCVMWSWYYQLDRGTNKFCIGIKYYV